MSATNRGAIRIHNDLYATPIPSIDALLQVLTIPEDATFLEPCRGPGDIFNRISCRQRLYCELSEGIDYLTYRPSQPIDLIVTNPPFTLALEFLQKSLSEATTVIYLLRLNYMGSRARCAFWQANRPTHLLTLSERPSFVDVCKGNKALRGKKKKGCGASFRPGATKVCPHCGGRVSSGTDATEYAWFCWDRAGIVDLDLGVYVL